MRSLSSIHTCDNGGILPGCVLGLFGKEKYQAYEVLVLRLDGCYVSSSFFGLKTMFMAVLWY